MIREKIDEILGKKYPDLMDKYLTRYLESNLKKEEGLI